MSLYVYVKVNILHPWSTATSQSLQPSPIDGTFGKVLISISRMSMFTKLFQKHSYFLDVFFTANDKFKLKVPRVLNFYPKGQQIPDQGSDSSCNTTLFAWRCNAAVLLKLPSCCWCHNRNTLPAALEHGCSVPPPANSSSGHKPEGLSQHRAKIPLRATSCLGRLTKPVTVALSQPTAAALPPKSSTVPLSHLSVMTGTGKCYLCYVYT